MFQFGAVSAKVEKRVRLTRAAAQWVGRAGKMSCVNIQSRISPYHHELVGSSVMRPQSSEQASVA